MFNPGQSKDELLEELQQAQAQLEALRSSVPDRQQMETALHERESLYQTLVQTIPYAIQEVDTSGRILFANAAHRQIFGYEPEELIGRSMYDLLADEEDRKTLQATVPILVSTQPKPVCFQGKNRRKDGSLLDVQVDWNYKRNQAGAVVGFVSVITDITERKQAADALERRVQERTEELATANTRLRWLLALHERDWQLIAYEIHDGFTQDLTGALLRLEACQRVSESNPDLAKEHFEAGLQLARQSLEESRRLIAGLRPPLLDEAGVVGAIDYLIEQRQQNTSTRIHFSHDANFGRLPRPMESTLFRIVQEGLNNALRHSRSDRVEIRLTQSNSSVQVEVEDWGTGFDPSRAVRDHYGLEGIRERAQSFGGQVSIVSVPGEGTCVRAELPLGDREQQA